MNLLVSSVFIVILEYLLKFEKFETTTYFYKEVSVLESENRTLWQSIGFCVISRCMQPSITSPSKFFDVQINQSNLLLNWY